MLFRKAGYRHELKCVPHVQYFCSFKQLHEWHVPTPWPPSSSFCKLPNNCKMAKEMVELQQTQTNQTSLHPLRVLIQTTSEVSHSLVSHLFQFGFIFLLFLLLSLFFLFLLFQMFLFFQSLQSFMLCPSLILKEALKLEGQLTSFPSGL